MPRPTRDTRYTFRTAEDANASLTNINAEIDKFLAAIAPDFSCAMRVGIGTDLEGHLAFLREAMTEHLRYDLCDAFEASGEHFDADPMAATVRKVA